MKESEFLQKVGNLSVFKKGDRRAPNKPVMLLFALARLQEGKAELMFNDIYGEVESILRSLVPQNKTVNALYPFWYLKTEGIWKLSNTEELTERKGKPEPLKSELVKNGVYAGFRPDILDLFRQSPALIPQAAQVILDSSFPESIHDDIIQMVGLNLEKASYSTSRNRDPKFRKNVLIAYQYACAVCGYSVRIDQDTVGLEAAHIKWHQANGPDTENNGLALCCLHHKLFDRGAFTIKINSNIRVSKLALGPGSNEAIWRFDGERIALPRDNSQHPKADFLEWHHDEVFVG